MILQDVLASRLWLNGPYQPSDSQSLAGLFAGPLRCHLHRERNSPCIAPNTPLALPESADHKHAKSLQCCKLIQITSCRHMHGSQRGGGGGGGGGHAE